MSESAAILLMMNNYLHDVATALLIADGWVMWLLWRNLKHDAEPAAPLYFIRLYRGMTRLAGWSLVWIIFGGIPRVMFYTEFEWSEMAGRGQVTALIIKHILAFSLVFAGAALWTKVRKKVLDLEKHQPPTV